MSSQKVIPEAAFLLGLVVTHTCPLQQLQAFSAAAALIVAKAGAGFAGLVAGLTVSHLWVTVEARATVPHTAALQEEEALFTPVTLILVTVATVGITRLAFKFFPVGLLRTGFITVVFEHVVPCSA